MSTPRNQYTDNLNDLTDKQELFVAEYMKDFNARQAAIRAGYSPRTAGRIGFDLKHNSKVKKMVAAKQKELRDEVMNQFISDAKRARDVMYDLLNDPDCPHAVKLNAAKDLLDRAGFKPVDKQEISGADGEPIQVFFNIPRPPKEIVDEQ